MTTTLVMAVSLVVIALLFYTVAVWGELAQRTLHRWHVAAFWSGLLCDVAGTWLMFEVAGRVHWNYHTFIGGVGIVIMCAHAVIATFIYLRGNAEARRRFARYGVAAWSVWSLAFTSGIVRP